jgi:hypothetical protein
MFWQLRHVINSVRVSFQRSWLESWAESWLFGYWSCESCSWSCSWSCTKRALIIIWTQQTKEKQGHRPVSSVLLLMKVLANSISSIGALVFWPVYIAKKAWHASEDVLLSVHNVCDAIFSCRKLYIVCIVATSSHLYVYTCVFLWVD